jgi:hypothetical protein
MLVSLALPVFNYSILVISLPNGEVVRKLSCMYILFIFQYQKAL